MSLRKNLEHLIFLDEEIKYLFVKKSHLIREIKVALPSKKSYEIALKKHSSSSFAEKIGIPVPKTFRVNDKKELDYIVSELSYPVVVKVERGDSSSQVRNSHDIDKLKRTFD